MFGVEKNQNWKEYGFFNSIEIEFEIFSGKNKVEKWIGCSEIIA